METNRYYTGLIRTPASIAWLIGQRARFKGEIDRLKRLERTLPERIKAAEAKMAALDVIIPFHEVKVDPQIIKGRRPKCRSAAPHGSITRFLLGQMRLAKGKPIYTTELALKFARDFNVDYSLIPHTLLMDRLKSRLVGLVNKGIVRRHHSTTARGMGSWSLVDDDQDEPRT